MECAAPYPWITSEEPTRLAAGSIKNSNSSTTLAKREEAKGESSEGSATREEDCQGRLESHVVGHWAGRHWLGRPPRSRTGPPACCGRVPLQTVTTAYAHVAMRSPRLDPSSGRPDRANWSCTTTASRGAAEGSWNAQTRPRTWTLSDDGGVAPALAGHGGLLSCLLTASTDGLPPFFPSPVSLDHNARNPSPCSGPMVLVAVPLCGPTFEPNHGLPFGCDRCIPP